jgi:hypothetical protein
MWKQFKEFFEGPELPSDVRIPLHDVATLSCGWGWGKPPCSLLLQVTRLAALAGTPSKQGQVQLFIPRADRDEARRLVKSIGRPGKDQQREWPGAIARARREVTVPGLGLLLSGVLGLLGWGTVLGLVIWDPTPFRFSNSAGDWAGVIILACLVTPAALVQGIGAVMMLRLKGYPLAATASILAMIPWSAAFLISLPCGIWTCVVLGKPEVAEAFYDPMESAIDGLAGEPNLPSGAVSRAFSYVRSVCGYFLPTMPGRTMKDEG